MSYLDKINNIKNKILKHDNFTFNKEERCIIQLDDELFSLYWQTLIKNPELIDSFTNEDDLLTVGDQTVLADAFSHASLEFWFKYTTYMYSCGTYPKEDFINFLSPYLDEEQLKEYRSWLNKTEFRLMDGIELPEETVSILLENEEYDYIFRNQDYIINFPQEFVDKFPFDKYELNSFEKFFLSEHGRDKMYLADKLKKIITSDSKFSLPVLLELYDPINKKNKIITSLITDRFLSGNNDCQLFSYMSKNSCIRKLFSYFRQLSSNEATEIFQKILDNGDIGIVFEIFDYNVIEGQVEIVLEKFNKIIDLLNSGKKIYNTDVTKLMKKNSKFKDAIIRSGSIDIILEYDDFNEDDINKIIGEIKREDSNYTLKINKPWLLLLKNHELFKALYDKKLLTKNGLTFMIGNEYARNIIVEDLKKGIDVEIDFRMLSNIDFEAMSELISANFALAYEYALYHPNKILNDDYLLSIYLKEKSPLSEQIIGYIQHHDDDSIYSDAIYNALKSYYKNIYNLDERHIDILKNKFGLRIIRYLNDENIKKIINLDDDQFNKVLNLFPMDKLVMKDLETFYDVLMQYEFSKRYPDVLSIFSDIKHSLDDGNEVYLEKIKLLKKVMNDKFYQKFKKIYPNIVYDDSDDLLTTIIAKIKRGNYDEQINYTNMLHFITNYYIGVSREEYVKDNYDIVNDLKLPYDFQIDDCIIKVIKILSKNPFYFADADFLKQYGIRREYLIKFILSNGMDESLVRDCMALFSQDRKHTYINNMKIIGQSMKSFVEYSKEYIKQVSKNCMNLIMQDMDRQNILKREYMASNNDDIFPILSVLRIDLLEEVLDSEEIYLSLQNTMRKYRPYLMSDDLKKFIGEKMGAYFDCDCISAFISYYKSIYEEEKNRMCSAGKQLNDVMPIIDVFNNCIVYGACSSVYSIILGSEDTNLIKSNPGPNRAVKKTENDQRLKESVQRTIKNFERQKVTVPTFNEVISIDGENGNEKKEMRVVVGNFTHPSNLTHGERTGSCMRIGGAGESLYEFCLEDPNGFHIRFEDSETGTYISRVSGFRNGNTVFLNELRCSSDKTLFSDREVVSVCRKTAQMLIEMSKDSEFPIDNVVIHNDYAIKGNDLRMIPLNITDNKVGLSNFYSDIGTSAILLASSSVDNSLVPINFDKSKVPMYSVAREKVRVFSPGKEKKSFIETVNRVEAVKSILEGKNYEYLEPKITCEEIIMGYANQDWYRYLDDKGNIHDGRIAIDKRAKEEYDSFRMVLMETKEKNGGYNNVSNSQIR